MRVGCRRDGPARPHVTWAADGGVMMPRSDQQTIQLIRQARAGSQEALGRLFDGCRRYLLRIASDDLDRRLHAGASAFSIASCRKCSRHERTRRRRPESGGSPC